MMREMRDEFLSEEDLELQDLSDEELFAYWDFWLEQAQATNDLDRHTYSHGVFATEPSAEQDQDEGYCQVNAKRTETAAI